MAPIRVARERLHQAARDELNCELGTDAARAAAMVRSGARAQLASAIMTAGGPKKLTEFVLKGPQESGGMAASQSVAAPIETPSATITSDKSEAGR
jgi:hypothetical protein